MESPQPDQPGHNDPGLGRRLGIDVGTVRIGTALSGSSATMAMPLETIKRQTGFHDYDKADIDRLVDIVEENDVVEVVVGLPRDLRGHGSKSVLHAQDIAERLAQRLPEIPIRMADERLSTVVAQQALRTSGINEKAGRKIIDQAAAVEILQSWLDGRLAYINRHLP
ncbi:Holliday junction resolvase RuvX [Corynebacterium sp. ES2794-CONJ1]|uniref:Holliday junction resolvase RuvX n=1 Tax=unclassified Corynebacterium TaxID=2624378 RepID=UPI002166C2C6|nr:MULTISPECIES: Holliday junction resolvase RuvX [unclassified Corynebacterium]MCS4489250.1 Holliday junction resolvase RuvX [Corynebacterium sp. ES2775-CONJ]MCS4491063.1 Holliday junction resolvase RuvX [Corynebacterium sp. ES2715-CONJ3]MCS4531056.1 Holliday junction resolvase RuvX [Corynebacterium sp. ES2730-CONJ]MCU9518423.1 Holliday junction resolvase RuvX [Corynebacterium sp. ES2794-CONJ1]